MICRTIFQGKKGNGNLLLRDIQRKRRAFIALKLKHHDLIHRCFWNIFKQNRIMYSPNFLSQIRSEFWNKFKGNYNSLQFPSNILHCPILTIWYDTHFSRMRGLPPNPLLTQFRKLQPSPLEVGIIWFNLFSLSFAYV